MAKSNIITITNKLLLLRDGVLQMFGPTNQVLDALNKQNQQLLLQRQQQEQAQQQEQQKIANDQPAAISEQE